MSLDEEPEWEDGELVAALHPVLSEYLPEDAHLTDVVVLVRYLNSDGASMEWQAADCPTSLHSLIVGDIFRLAVSHAQRADEREEQ